MHSVNTRGFYQGQDAYHHQPPKLKRYYTFLCPATLAAISFILVVLAIVAGQPRGFAHADDYSIIYFNTSTLGQGLLNGTSQNPLNGTNSTSTLQNRAAAPLPAVTSPPSLLRRYRAAGPDKRFGISDLGSGASAAATAAAAGATKASSAVASAVGAAQSSLAHLVSEARADLETIEGPLADELSARLGLPQWYAVHLTTLCCGNFTPAAAAANATWGARNCTAPFRWGGNSVRDLTATFNRSLGAGPFQLNLADIGLARDAAAALDDAMALLDTCVRAVAALYVLAAACIGLSMTLSVCAVFALKSNEVQEGQWAPTLARRTKQIFFHGTALSTAAGWALLLAGNVVTTWGGAKVVRAVRAHGGEALGLRAFRGGRFLALTWGALAVFCFVLAYWLLEEWTDWRRGRKYAPAKAAYLAKFGDGFDSRENSSDWGKYERR